MSENIKVYVKQALEMRPGCVNQADVDAVADGVTIQIDGQPPKTISGKEATILVQELQQAIKLQRSVFGKNV